MAWGVKYSWHPPTGNFARKSDAQRMAKQMRESNKQAGLSGAVKVVKIGSNPARGRTKAERAVASQKASAKRRVAVALAKFLRQQNPGAKLAGAKVEKLGGGVIKITPIKMNRGRKR